MKNLDIWELFDQIQYYAPYIKPKDTWNLLQNGLNEDMMVGISAVIEPFIEEDCYSVNVKTCASVCPTASERSCMPYDEEEDDDDCVELLRELEETVNRLRKLGVPMETIREIIERQEKLSSLYITDDYRIFLPEYGNMEIEMKALPKALFLFFILHEEGVVLKCLPDYYNEIYGIYKKLKPNYNEEKLRTSVTALVNPLGNRLNENLSLIRYAFTSKFDEHLAKYYYVSGEKGQEYRILLDKDLVRFEE